MCWSILLSAFQMPGCVKEIMPTTMTLNSGLLNHRVKRDTGFGACTSWVAPSSGCLTTSVDIAAASFAGADMFSYKNGRVRQQVPRIKAFYHVYYMNSTAKPVR